MERTVGRTPTVEQNLLLEVAYVNGNSLSVVTVGFNVAIHEDSMSRTQRSLQESSHLLCDRTI